MRRTEEPMEDQNRVNKEMERNTQKMGTQRVIATKPKPVEEKDTQKQ